MVDYTSTYNLMRNTPLVDGLTRFKRNVTAALVSARWGDLPRWLDVVKQLPLISASDIDLTADCIGIGKKQDCSAADQVIVESLLRQLQPWRKGPFKLFDIFVDTEWRSDIKWNRLNNHIESLQGRLVLDIGCGSGYHALRMAGAGAKLSVGIDPTMLYVIQFQAMQKYIRNPSVNVFPIGIDNMPPEMNCFDTVFSMGLLYHRRSPLDHLLQLKSFLREGGQVVLETLVIDGDLGQTLIPSDRYACMPNVWLIPSCPTLESWLKRVGFHNVRCIDVTRTTAEEQRATDWMGLRSLDAFLDPHNPLLTIEGYPAPQRAVFLAEHP